jgi:HAE1 family hydrophobic/amphiphilic exporter-1
VAFSLGRAKRMMLIFLAVLAAVWLLMAKLPTSFLPTRTRALSMST